MEVGLRGQPCKHRLYGCRIASSVLREAVAERPILVRAFYKSTNMCSDRMPRLSPSSSVIRRNSAFFYSTLRLFIALIRISERALLRAAPPSTSSASPPSRTHADAARHQLQVDAPEEGAQIPHSLGHAAPAPSARPPRPARTQQRYNDTLQIIVLLGLLQRARPLARPFPFLETCDQQRRAVTDQEEYQSDERHHFEISEGLAGNEICSVQQLIDGDGRQQRDFLEDLD